MAFRTIIISVLFCILPSKGVATQSFPFQRFYPIATEWSVQKKMKFSHTPAKWQSHSDDALTKIIGKITASRKRDYWKDKVNLSQSFVHGAHAYSDVQAKGSSCHLPSKRLSLCLEIVHTRRFAEVTELSWDRTRSTLFAEYTF